MKRIFICMLSVLLLFSSVPPSAANARGIVVSEANIRRGIFLCRFAGQYSTSIRLFAYSLDGAKHVRFGEKSVLSRKLAESEQLLTLAHDALAGGNTKGSGSVSFYDGGDLAFAIGMANYTMELIEDSGKMYARFTISDRYDFTELREGNSFSVLLNNWGYRLQADGVLHVYDWAAEVLILLEA